MSIGPVQFNNPLGNPMLWAILAGVPVGIIALYFLKLRRRPVQVPSTLLWRRSLEDLHVNSLFQRLRKNLLLFLQLAAVLLVMLALTGPRIRGTSSLGERYVLAIDNSASMAATDVEPSRLERAKADAKKLVQGMNSSDLAMIVTFSDRAKVIQSYTGIRSQLLDHIDQIKPTEATTSLREALEVAAGLANPSKQAEGVAANNIVPPMLKIYTDGGFADVEGFSLGNLKPEVIVIGAAPAALPPETDAQARAEARSKPSSNNVAILALQTRRNEEKQDVFQVFGRVHNYKDEDVETKAQLYKLDPTKPGAAGTLIDAVALKIARQSDQSFNFDLPDTGATELEVRLDVKDDQTLDNRAFTLVGKPRKAQILIVTEGNRYLVDTLRTPLAAERADVIVVKPDEYKTDAYKRDVAAGRFDLVIYDRITPETAPEANALYFGALPPGKAYANSRTVESPAILDVNAAHPLMQFIRELGVIRVLKATIVDPPPGSTVLFECDSGPIAFVAPRNGFSDAVIAFSLVEGRSFNTDWVTKYSFPLFLFNAIQALGNARESAGEEVHVPGQTVALRAESAPATMTITDPTGKISMPIPRSSQGVYLYNEANLTGIYHARWEPNGVQSFAVNQFDKRESDLAPRGIVPEGTPEGQIEAYKIKIGYSPVEGTRKTVSAPMDWWWIIAAAALLVVCVEWYIYNRRVYI